MGHVSLESITPDGAVEAARYELAAEFGEDLRPHRHPAA
jgi:hypothetical protein